MSLNFENASVLSLEKTINYFDSEYAFSCEKNMSVQGFFYDGSNAEGVKEIQEDLDSFVSSTDGKLHDVIINGHNFGKGKVNSFTSGSDNSVRLKEYTVDITIFENGDLSNLNGETHFAAFQGLISDSNRKFIRNISEDFSFAKNDGSYDYTHELSIQFYDHGESSIDGPIDLAKSLAKTILETDVDFGFLDSQVSGFYNLAHKKYYSETYDKVNNVCSFSESYSQPSATNSLYSSATSHSLTVNEGGIMDVSETSNIKALTKVSASVLAGYVSTELSGSFARCESIASSFNSGLYENSSLPNNSKTDYDLINQYIDLNKSFDHFSCSANYSVTYTNSESTFSGFICERTVSAELQDEVATLKESGSVLGLEGLESEQYTKALNGFKTTIEPNISSRLNSFYSSTFPNLSSQIKEVGSSFSSNERNGSVDYSKTYSNNPALSDPSFKSIVTSEELALSVTYKNDFKILASGQALEQYKGLTPASKYVKISVSGKRETTEASCKQKAVELANSYAPSGMFDAHMNSLSYNFSPKEKTYSLDASWLYYEDSATLCSKSVSIDEPVGKSKKIYGLVSLWRMDETSSGAVSDLYGGNNGTRSFSGSSSGKYGQAFVFANGNTVDFGRGSGCPATSCGWDKIFLSRNFSASLWYKPTTEGKKLLNKNNCFTLSDGIFTQGNGSQTLFNKGTLNSWNHLLITSSDGLGSAQDGIYIYLNGSRVYSIPSPVFNAADTTTLIAGGDFAGHMDDLRIYDTTLSPYQVYLIYRAEDLLPDGNSPYTS
jgi:hypothetical protein